MVIQDDAASGRAPLKNAGRKTLGASLPTAGAYIGVLYFSQGCALLYSLPSLSSTIDEKQNRNKEYIAAAPFCGIIERGREELLC